MKNYNNIDTVYTKRLKTVQPKIEQDDIADSQDNNKPEVKHLDHVHEILKSIYRQLDDDQEHMVMLVLNISNEISGFKVIASGSQTSSPADAKIIFRNALMLGATKIVLAHNHPSGNLQPSNADIRFTQKIIAAGKAIEIPVVDHIILSHSGYISMRKKQHCEFEASV